MARAQWHYEGDVNIEHGGLFYRMATFEQGWVDFTRCQPCSDAGGPDNCYWIERGSVSIDTTEVRAAFWGTGDTAQARRAHRLLHDMPHAQRIEDALACCGWDRQLDRWDALTRAQRRHAIVGALIAYGACDVDSSIMIQIGPTQAQYSPRNGVFMPNKVLRSNTNLRNYVREVHCTLD